MDQVISISLNELHVLTGLCGDLAGVCTALTHRLNSNQMLEICRKRLAYQSAVRLTQADDPFDHRALYSRLFDVAVAGETNRLTALDAGRAQLAAEVYTQLLSGRRKTPSKAQSCRSPALASVNAYDDAAARAGPMEASLAALDWLEINGWLPTPAPPVAWSFGEVSQKRTPNSYTVSLKAIRSSVSTLYSTLKAADDLVTHIAAFLYAAQDAASHFREGSAARVLIRHLAQEPVVTQGYILKEGVMSDVAFQNGIRALEEIGICAEITGRQRHRAWIAAGTGLMPPFENYMCAPFPPEPAKDEQLSAGNNVSPLAASNFTELDKAMIEVERLTEEFPTT